MSSFPCLLRRPSCPFSLLCCSSISTAPLSLSVPLSFCLHHSPHSAYSARPISQLSSRNSPLVRSIPRLAVRSDDTLMCIQTPFAPLLRGEGELACGAELPLMLHSRFLLPSPPPSARQDSLETFYRFARFPNIVDVCLGNWLSYRWDKCLFSISSAGTSAGRPACPRARPAPSLLSPSATFLSLLFASLVFPVATPTPPRLPSPSLLLLLLSLPRSVYALPIHFLGRL